MERRKSLPEVLRPYKGVRIAEAVGCTPASVSKWTKGSRPEPRYWPKLADFLRLDLAELSRIIAADDAAAREELRAS